MFYAYYLLTLRGLSISMSWPLFRLLERSSSVLSTSRPLSVLSGESSRSRSRFSFSCCCCCVRCWWCCCCWCCCCCCWWWWWWCIWLLRCCCCCKCCWCRANWCGDIKCNCVCNCGNMEVCIGLVELLLLLLLACNDCWFNDSVES